MANYMEDSEAIIQNLKDAGCDKTTVEQFVEFSKGRDKQKQFKLLEKHRRILLEKVHRNEKQIDCLDFLIFQMRKEKNDMLQETKHLTRNK